LKAYIFSFITGKSSEKHSRNISCTVVVESIHAGSYLSVQIQESMSLCAHDGGRCDVGIRCGLISSWKTIALRSSYHSEACELQHAIDFMRGKFVAPGAHLGKQKFPKECHGSGSVCCAQQLGFTKYEWPPTRDVFHEAQTSVHVDSILHGYGVTFVKLRNMSWDGSSP